MSTPIDMKSPEVAKDSATRAGLDLELFRNPTSQFRGTPFWSWNAKLDIDQLLRQIDQLKEMGFGGFHMHARTGLETPYLGPEFMDAIKACTEKAASEHMLAWLYDEDRWPSGFAGGLVTKEPKFRCKHLLWTTKPYNGQVAQACQDERAAGTRSENGKLIARYDVVLSEGILVGYRRMRDAETVESASGTVWYAYLETCQESTWFNGQTYVDTLSRPAIERFIEVTHEKYFEAVGEHFGKTIPAIFTDEPQFPKKTTLQKATDLLDVILPFTTDFVDSYKQAYKIDLLDHLPELFWELPDGQASVARYNYHDHTAERFAAAFGDTIGQWCEKHGIQLTGHMLGEPTLFSQTRGIGEAMRSLRSFTLPGIDMLCDRLELTTAKQAQSVSRQYARSGVISELYGVTNWDFDFVGHKRQGDWQAALGVTVRVPHLTWLSMAGESKRDYPAAIGYQSPWYKEYPIVEDHFARLNTVLTRGTSSVRVGVVHPVESYWLCFGPVDQNQAEMKEREDAFANITEWLSFGLIDFDFISESLLPTQTPAGQKGKQFQVGAMHYDVIVVPAMRTIRGTTLKQLEQFASAGGTVVFAGEIPSLVDAVPSAAPAELAARCQRIEYTRRQVLQSLAKFSDLSVTHPDGTAAETLVYQIRLDGDARYAFLCNTSRNKGFVGSTVKLRGHWYVSVLDTMTGDVREMPIQGTEDSTMFQWDIQPHDHLLLKLTVRRRSAKDVTPARGSWSPVRALVDPVPVTLSEPNVLLLDQAGWRLDNGPWQDVEEVLRLENQARRQLNLPLRGGRISQPWTDTKPAPVVAYLQLRYKITSEVAVTTPQLAMENVAAAKVYLDGELVPSTVMGWWVDESIHTIALPSFAAGEHELLIDIPFTRKTDVEWCYLLGDFGVSVQGRRAKLTESVRMLSFGDWTPQGLPFFAGNVTYHCTIEGDGRELRVETPKFKNPLLTVELNGRPAGKIAYAPFTCNLGPVKGTARLDITAYGNRVNAFGPIHNAHENLSWVGPAAWRSIGAHWAYEYQFKRMGVLVTPTLEAKD